MGDAAIVDDPTASEKKTAAVANEELHLTDVANRYQDFQKTTTATSSSMGSLYGQPGQVSLLTGYLYKAGSVMMRTGLVYVYNIYTNNTYRDREI